MQIALACYWLVSWCPLCSPYCMLRRFGANASEPVLWGTRVGQQVRLAGDIGIWRSGIWWHNKHAQKRKLNARNNITKVINIKTDNCVTGQIIHFIKDLICWQKYRLSHILRTSMCRFSAIISWAYRSLPILTVQNKRMIPYAQQRRYVVGGWVGGFGMGMARTSQF